MAEVSTDLLLPSGLPNNEITTGCCQIISVDSSTIDNLIGVNGASREKINDIYDTGFVGKKFRWVVGQPLFTVGVATCLVFILFRLDKKELGAAHIPYFTPDRRISPDYPQTVGENEVGEALSLLKQKGGVWELHLFGGQPSDEGESAKKDKMRNIKTVIGQFESLDIQCYDHTVDSPDLNIDTILADPTTNKIWVNYSTNTSNLT